MQVSIASDVLFAVDSATLAPAAKRLLKKTAAQIGGGTVKVEGHADDTGTGTGTGTDEINDPLSQRRAEAVAGLLRALVPAATFEPKGFGSRNPLYSNDEEEGRRRNRRVTITFTRDPAAPVASAPTATAVSGTSQADGFTVTPDALRPAGDGLGVLTYTVTNANPKEAWLHQLAKNESWQRIRFNAAVNVKLADGDRKIHPARYVVQEDNTARATLCLCSSTSGVWSTANHFAPNETKHFWALLQLPSTPTTTAEIADLPAVSVSVSQ